MQLASFIPYFEKLAEEGLLPKDRLEFIRKEVESFAKKEQDDSGKEESKSEEKKVNEKPEEMANKDWTMEEIGKQCYKSDPVAKDEKKTEKKAVSLWNKLASAYIEDLTYGSLPKEVKTDVDRFGTCKNDTKLIHYGMVVDELLSKVDENNYASAKEHIKDVKKDDVYKKLKTKYIILINDKVVDGHHFIRKCELAGVTSSLNVLDLTPVRFQK